jgi:hypothetical protein
LWQAASPGGMWAVMPPFGDATSRRAGPAARIGARESQRPFNGIEGAGARRRWRRGRGGKWQAGSGRADCRTRCSCRGVTV